MCVFAVCCALLCERCASDYYRYYYYVNERQACHDVPRSHTKIYTNNFRRACGNEPMEDDRPKAERGGRLGQNVWREESEKRCARAKVFPTAFEPNANTHKLDMRMR